MKLPQLNLKKIPIYSGLSTKHKKTANLILGGVVAVTAVSLVSSLLESKPTPPGGVAVGERRPEAKSATGNAAPGGTVTPEQYWMNTEGQRVNELMEFMKAQKANQGKDRAASVAAAAASALDDTPAVAQKPAPAASVSQPAQAKVTRTDAQTVAADEASIPKGARVPGSGPSKGGSGNAPGALAGYSNFPPGSPNGGRQGNSNVPQADAAATWQQAQPMSAPLQSVSLTEESGAKKDEDGAKGAGGSSGAGNRYVNRNFLPVGFVRAKLLGGLDAPTGGQGQNDPIPVPILLKDNGFLPNNFRSKIKDCFVIAHGHGDLSSERAYLRLVTLSCVMKDGRVIETRAQGSVFGDDGLNGIRGKLITKQGQVLANALMAGIASGIGKSFASQGQTTSTSPLGTTTTPSTDPSQALRNGLGQGTGDALNRLAQYWISAADKMFPVIEIGGARDVDIVFTSGITIDSLEDAPATAQNGGYDLPRRVVNRAADAERLIAQ